jgi:hypothetical protein
MTIKRILEVTKSYSIRHFFKDSNFIKPYLLEMSDMYMRRITSNIPDNQIHSILFCDFDERKNIAYETVKWFKDNKDSKITDHNIPVTNFKFWYGVYNGKFKCDTLDNLPDDMIVMPVRNLKSDITEPFNSLIIRDGVLFLKNDNEYLTKLPYTQDGDNIGKCILISENGKSLFVYGVRSVNKDEIEEINKFLSENPSYPIMVDNGRYLFYFIGDNIKKHAFVCGGFSDIDDMFVFGSLKE